MHRISGKVVAGDKYGRKLGFPTVNLDTEISDIRPGIYNGRGEINNKNYRAAIIVHDSKIQACLLGYRGDAYGKTVMLNVGKFLRDFKTFPTESELKEQIVKDLKMC